MEWLNLHTSTLDSEAFMDASPPHRSTWLLLLRYCIGQENGGTIEGVRSWPDMKCIRLLGLTQAEIQDESDLWGWEGDNLVVEFYPTDKEKSVRAARKNGRNGVRKRWAMASAIPPATPSQPLPAIPPAIAPENTEGKGREEKRMERSISREGVVFEIVAAYPVRTDQAEAERAILEAIDAGEDPTVMLSGTRAIAEVIASAPSGSRNKYVPSPARFFRERKYRDDPAVWRARFEKNAAGVANSFATEAPRSDLRPKIL